MTELPNLEILYSSAFMPCSIKVSDSLRLCIAKPRFIYSKIAKTWSDSAPLVAIHVKPSLWG